MAEGQSKSGMLKAGLLHLLCILALMWMPLANGFAFFFDDTTNYIRAADMAANMASGGTIETAWSERYSAKAPASAEAPADDAPAAPEERSGPELGTHNDVSSGLVMVNRSPYMGALMWAGYVTSNFWLFIAFQAALAYFLITLTLDRFGINRTKVRTGMVLVLAALTTLPFYNGLLLADAFGAFGILAFLLLAMPGKLTRFQVFILFMTIVTAVVSHLTHIVMLAAMLATLALLGWIRLAPRMGARGWVAGLAGLVIGVASVQLTAFATEKAIGKEPLSLPLMTARFIADGPGLDYIRSGCDGNRFQICRVELGDTTHASAILSTRQPGVGTYMLAAPDERRRMGEEDRAFAIAVLMHDPIGQGSAIIGNTLRQLTWVEYTGLNRPCAETPNCEQAIPPEVRAHMSDTLAEREAWPEAVLDVVFKLTVLVAFAVLAYALVRGPARGDARIVTLRIWVVVSLAAMVLMSVFGGAIVEPQWRYISRLIWLAVLFAMIAAVIHWGKPERDAADPPHR